MMILAGAALPLLVSWHMEFYIEACGYRIARGDYAIDKPDTDPVHGCANNVKSDAGRARGSAASAIGAQFLTSDHFKSTPYQWIHAHMLAHLKGKW